MSEVQDFVAELQLGLDLLVSFRACLNPECGQQFSPTVGTVPEDINRSPRCAVHTRAWAEMRRLILPS